MRAINVDDCALSVAVISATRLDDTRATTSPFSTRSPLRTNSSSTFTVYSELLVPGSPTTMPSARWYSTPPATLSVIHVITDISPRKYPNFTTPDRLMTTSFVAQPGGTDRDG